MRNISSGRDPPPPSRLRHSLRLTGTGWRAVSLNLTNLARSNRKEQAVENIQIEERDGKLVITVDPTVRLPKKEDGKMTPVANSGGFQPVPGFPNLKINLYIGEK